jgi:hypothetical protein
VLHQTTAPLALKKLRRGDRQRTCLPPAPGREHLLRR